MPYVDCPVFIIHGSDDKIVPFEHGQILHDLAPNKFPPYWVEGRGHNDLCEGDFGWSKFYEHKVLKFNKILFFVLKIDENLFQVCSCSVVLLGLLRM